MSQRHWDLRGLGGKWVCAAPCHTRRVAGERDDWRYRVIGLLLGRRQAMRRNYVRDAAVPCGFARPWRQVRLRGAVPLGGAPDPQRCAAVASAHLRLHTLTSVHLPLHALTSADILLYLHTPTHLHIYSTHPHLHIYSISHLHIRTVTPSHPPSRSLFLHLSLDILNLITSKLLTQ